MNLKMERAMNKYAQFIVIIRRTGMNGKAKASYSLDTKAVEAFNEKYHNIVEFISDYKGNLELLLLDKLDKLN